MASVSVVINDKSYSIACEEGQEERVIALGEYINKRLNDITGAAAASNEFQTMVLTSLVLTDELFELKEQLEQAKAQMAELEQQGHNIPKPQEADAEELEKMRQDLMNAASEREANIAFSISELAEDIQGLAKRLKSI